MREAIEEIGGTMPEPSPPEPSRKPLLAAKRRRQKKLSEKTAEQTTEASPGETSQPTLWVC